MKREVGLNLHVRGICCSPFRLRLGLQDDQSRDRGPKGAGVVSREGVKATRWPKLPKPYRIRGGVGALKDAWPRLSVLAEGGPGGRGQLGSGDNMSPRNGEAVQDVVKVMAGGKGEVILVEEGTANILEAVPKKGIRGNHGGGGDGLNSAIISVEEGKLEKDRVTVLGVQGKDALHSKMQEGFSTRTDKGVGGAIRFNSSRVCDEGVVSRGSASRGRGELGEGISIQRLPRVGREAEEKPCRLGLHGEDVGTERRQADSSTREGQFTYVVSWEEAALEGGFLFNQVRRSDKLINGLLHRWEVDRGRHPEVGLVDRLGGQTLHGYVAAAKKIDPEATPWSTSPPHVVG